MAIIYVLLNRSRNGRNGSPTANNTDSEEEDSLSIASEDLEFLGSGFRDDVGRNSPPEVMMINFLHLCVLYNLLIKVGEEVISPFTLDECFDLKGERYKWHCPETTPEDMAILKAYAERSTLLHSVVKNAKASEDMTLSKHSEVQKTSGLEQYCQACYE